MSIPLSPAERDIVDRLCREQPHIADYLRSHIGHRIGMTESHHSNPEWFAMARGHIEESAIAVPAHIPDSEHHVCYKCHGRSILARERTLRASDEPTSMEFTCLTCSNTWLE